MYLLVFSAFNFLFSKIDLAFRTNAIVQTIINFYTNSGGNHEKVSCFSDSSHHWNKLFWSAVTSLKSIKKTDYLQKSKNQRTAAWVLLGGGIAMTVTGTVIYGNAYDKAAEDDPFGTLVSFGTNVNPTGAIIATAGLLAAASSIPFFIASGKNKRRARAVSTGFKMEHTPAIQRASIVNRSYPAVAMEISL
jgi:hypothetical protein